MTDYPGDDAEADRRTLTAVAGLVFARDPDPRVRTRSEIVKRVSFLVDRVREAQGKQDTLSQVIAALEAGEAKRQSK